MQRHALVFKFLFALLLAGTWSAHAQYPNRPIRLIVPTTAGSGTDIFARIISEPLSQALGQQVVIDNKPGVNTTVGAHAAAQAAPDGYTVILGASSGLAASPAGLVRNVPYDPIRDFSYISLMGTISYVWLVSNDIGVKTAQELIKYIKSNPGKLNYGSANASGVAYMAFVKRVYDLEVTHVAYKSASPAYVDLLSGRIQIMVSDVVTATPLVRANKVKAIAAVSAQRTPLLPELPTLGESGIQNVPDLTSWWAMCAPSGVPAEILDRLNKELVAILARPSIRERLIQNGIFPTPSTRQEAERHQREQLQVWAKAIKDFGLQSEQ